MATVTVIGSSGFRMECEIHKEGNCKSCGKRIIWGINKSGTWCPIDPWVEGEDAIIHFASCPYADKHRKPPKGKNPPPDSPHMSRNGDEAQARRDGQFRKMLDEARRAGYDTGHLDGYQAAMATTKVRFPHDVWIRAVRLCHPDRHRPEDWADANEVLVWLNANKPQR